MLLTKAAHQIANFQTCHYSHENLPNSSCHFWNQESVFLQTLHHSSVLSHLKIYMLWTKGAHESEDFQTFNSPFMPFFKSRVSFPLNVIFQTKSQFFFKVWTTLQCHERKLFSTFLAETLYAIDKSSTTK